MDITIEDVMEFISNNTDHIPYMNKIKKAVTPFTTRSIQKKNKEEMASLGYPEDRIDENPFI